MKIPRLTKKYIHKAKNLPKHSSPIFFIFVGIPGSGKTTYAKFLERYMLAARVATDEIKLYCLAKKIRYTTKELFEIQKDIFGEIIRYNVNIISDSNSATSKYRQNLRKFAKKNGYVPIVIYCSASKEIIKERVYQRKSVKGVKNFYISPERLRGYMDELEPPKKCIFVDTAIEFGKSKKCLIESINKWVKN